MEKLIIFIFAQSKIYRITRKEKNMKITQIKNLTQDHVGKNIMVQGAIG